VRNRKWFPAFRIEPNVLIFCILFGSYFLGKKILASYSRQNSIPLRSSKENNMTQDFIAATEVKFILKLKKKNLKTSQTYFFKISFCFFFFKKQNGRVKFRKIGGTFAGKIIENLTEILFLNYFLLAACQNM
jgi:hypothetical protein